MNILNYLRDSGIALYVLHNMDRYQSWYTSFNRLEWICGFSGSHGWVVVDTSANRIHLFTDGRYIVQAHSEVDLSIVTVHNTNTSQIWDWIATTYPNTAVHYDSEYMSVKHLQRFTNPMTATAEDLVLKLSRKSCYTEQIIVDYDIQYSGETKEQKCSAIASMLNTNEVFLISAPDSISWLLNIRNQNFKFNPSVKGYVILYSNGTFRLFADYLSAKSCIAISDVSSLIGALEQYTVRFDPDTTTIDIVIHCKQSVQDDDPTVELRAVKNVTEIANAKKIHIVDGLALTRFLYYVQNTVDVTELELQNELLKFRSSNKDFVGSSFASISGFGSNAAIIHYDATKQERSTLVSGDGIYLIDSGGQYLGGTTDVTRSIAIGNPSRYQREIFTLVLKGHIAMASLIFKAGTSGSTIDVLARTALWQRGLDYPHSTGHGVSNYLSVHEGPHALSKSNTVELKCNMILSNEPGYYLPDNFGIRIENLMYIEQSKYEGFFKFTQLTCVPIDLKMICHDMLSQFEITWLNQYHSWVYEQLKHHMTNHDEINWLQVQCRQI